MKKWYSMMLGIAAALMLTACGAAEDEIQMVEQEDIAAPSLREDAAETSAQPEGEQPEKEADETSESDDAMEVQGKPAVVEIETKEQEYKDGDKVLLITNYDNVTVSMEENGEAAQAIQAVFDKRQQDFEKNAAEIFEIAKEDEYIRESAMSYMQGQRYAAERNDGRVLSFASLTDDFSGGAHGNYAEYGLNFDMETGKALAIVDIVQDMDAFREISVGEMLKQCEDLKAQGMLFDEAMAGDLQEILEAKMDGEEWYFTEEGIRFISNIYEIAPYAAGKFQFDIPYDILNETLKEEYRG